MASTASETRTTDAWDDVLSSEDITLVSTPAPAEESSVAFQTTTPFEEPLTFPQSNQADTTARDAVFASLASQPFSPLSTPPKPLPPPAANMAGSGGRGVGGVSTPNAGGGGGGGPTGGGGGPGLIDANTFLGYSFGGSGTAAGTNSIGPAANAAASTFAPATPPTALPANGPNASSLPTDLQTTYSMTAPTQAGGLNHFKPPSDHGFNPHNGGDPLYVLDMNTGETVPANVTLNTFSTWSENLLAQVSGATVSSYSWNLSKAPDLTNVSGTTTANLQGTWANFSGSTRTDTLSVTETPQSGSAITVTMTFAVASTSSPAYSSTQPTTSSTWPTVITPDQLLSGQPTQAAGPYAYIGEVDGSVQTSFSMPSYNPNTTPVSLDYNSTTANPQPIFLTEYQLPLGQSVPSTITAQLTFDGTALFTVTYSTADLNPGDIVQIALQADANGLDTGRYPWSITVTNGSTPTTYSGNVDIVDQANSPYGAGWSLDNVEQLVSVSGGVMLVNPDGTSFFFASNGQGGFTTPAGNFSTLGRVQKQVRRAGGVSPLILHPSENQGADAPRSPWKLFLDASLVQNTNGSYTQTLSDGTQINFNSSGQETSSVDTNDNTTSFSYTSGLLTSITDMNGQVTTLAYNTSGLLSSITDPADRTATMSYTGTQLTSITDAGNNVWQYGYDSANDLTTLTDPNNNTTTFTYNFADRVSNVTQPDGSTESLTAEQMNGLAAPGTGTSGDPATSVLLATGDQALFTDANNNVWTTGFDWLGYGVDTEDIDPLGDTSLNYINTNGLVWMSSDPLSRPTVDFYDSQGNVIEEVAPDDTTQQYQYNSFSEVTQYTDADGYVTTYSYNSNGDLTQMTDPLGDVTSYAYNPAGLVTSTTDANGNTTTYAYNSLNELTSTTDALGDVTSYSYDNAGDQTSVTDALGNVTTYSYNALGLMTGETLPDTPGVYSTYTYTYDKVGNQLSVTDPNGNTTTYGYNAVNEQTSETDVLNQTTTYGYDAVGNQTSVTTPLGTTTYAYNAANEQISMTDPMGNTTTYGYDKAGEQTSVTDPMDNVTDYSYNAVGEQVSQSVYNSSDTLVQQTVYSYDADGNLLSNATVNPSLDGISISASLFDTLSGSYTATLGGSVSGSFSGSFSGSVVNSDNNQVVGSIVGNFSGTISGGLSSSGQLSGGFTGSGTATLSGGISGSIPITISSFALSGTNSGGSGSISGTDYSNLTGDVNNVGGISGNLGGSLSIVFSGGGNGWTGGAGYTDGGPLSGSAGPATITTYNPVGEPISVTDPTGNTTTTTYDHVGNVTSITDGNGNTTTYTYNPINETVSVTNQTCGCAGMSGTTTYDYNAVGDQTSVTDASGNVTSYSYNAQGQVLTETAPNGGVTSYTYDLDGNETSETDPDDNTTEYSYNAVDQLVSTTNPQGYVSTNSYNAAGLLTSTTDADGNTIDYAYNADGQETSETWVGGNYTATYEYNADGEMTEASDPYSVYTYTYNALGQETSVSNAGTPGVPTVTLSYGYDSFGNRTSLTDSLGGKISYGYNADNEMTSLSLSSGSTVYAQVTLAYDGAGNVTGMTRTTPSVFGSHTIATSYSYNDSNELTNITDTDTTSGTTLASYTYGYNTAGVLTSYEDNSGNSLTYGYDANDELTSATGTLAGSSYSVSYNYDLNGNRTSTSTDVGGTVTSATYSTGTGNELTSDGTYDYTYDNNGNMTSQTDIATGSVTYYTWDYENRLTGVTVENSQGQVLEDEKFTYDMFGNQIGVSLNGTQQLYTVYDGSNPYMDFNGSGTLTERYLTNPNALSQYYGQVSASGTTEWFLTDNLNSIRQVITASGTSLDAITYDPFGNIIGQTNSANASRFLYTGAAYDPITGTYLDGARDEDPEDGRWLSQDPLSFAAGDMNLYRYVGNGPADEIDPSGLTAGPGGTFKAIVWTVEAWVFSEADRWTRQGWFSTPDVYTSGDLEFDLWPWGSTSLTAKALAFGRTIEKEYKWVEEMGLDPDRFGNAARHLMWQAMLTIKWGYRSARLVGNAHEAGGEDCLDSLTDQWNNISGRELGQSIRSALQHVAQDNGTNYTDFVNSNYNIIEKYVESQVRQMILDAVEDPYGTPIIVTWDDGLLTWLPGYRPGMPREHRNWFRGSSD